MGCAASIPVVPYNMQDGLFGQSAKLRAGQDLTNDLLDQPRSAGVEGKAKRPNTMDPSLLQADGAADKVSRQGSCSSLMPLLQSPKKPLVHQAELANPLPRGPTLENNSQNHFSLQQPREQDSSGCVPMQEAESTAELLPGLQTRDPRDGINDAVYPDNLYPLRPGPDAPFSPKGAPIPNDEAFRLSVLHSYNILDTAPEARFDRLTALASMIFKTPVALVSLVDSERQWFKSDHGLGCCATSREDSFCAFTLLPSRDPCLIVRDATKDNRFSKNNLVIGPPHIRFYAGAPLVTQGSYILGSLCVIDFKPREFTDQDRDLLISLAQLVVMEIEKHTKALELQRLQAERFEEDKKGLLQAIDAFSEGLVLWDASEAAQPIVFVNEGWEAITGYKIDEVIGLSNSSLLMGPLTEQCMSDQLDRACNEATECSVEVLHYRKDGTPFWNWMRIRPVESKSEMFGGGNGANHRYFFGVLSDCTVRKEKELELERRRLKEVEAEATIRAKRSFVTNVSHEIRTPMNAIIACSQLLQDSSDLNESQRELAQMINGSGRQLLSLINDILDYSKLDARKMDLSPREFNLWGCIDFCMEMLVLKCENKGLDLSYSLDESVPDWIWADEVRVRQVITNLLSNAAKFTEEGGQIEVTVSARAGRRRAVSNGGFTGAGEPPPHAGHALPVHEITVSVRDTGVGIPKAFQNVLFEAFTQCDNTRTRKYEGTGLGLAISKELVERMGGRMWVDSTEGVGSTFFFSIHVHGSLIETNGEPHLVAGSAAGRAATPLTGKRALLVGASKAFKRMAGSMLHSWGVEVEVVETPSQLRKKVGWFSGGALRQSSEAWAENSELTASDVTYLVEVTEAAATEGLSAPVAPHRTSVDGIARLSGDGMSSALGTRLEPLSRAFSLPSPVPARRAYDVVIVDTPMTSSHGEDDVMAHERAIELMQLGCACGERVPTVLLMAKHSTGQITFDSKMLERVTLLSRPVRINPFYAALLKLLVRESPISPITANNVHRTRVTAEDLPRDTSLRICIAEDNIINQRVLLKLLKSMGYAGVRTAVNGVRLLKLLEESPADLVLMDLQMPEMDGLEATRQIRSVYGEAERPIVVALTADVGPGIEQECRDAGMVSYLSKPIQKEELERLFAKCLHLKGHPQERMALKWLS
ncbi:cell cycle sensor kinase and response regulator [Klebsormidium nitens]|uniref:Cell cycle sensor kinase and response regulator n=1 Tax=Klebsormidium nitens TaxID=105231 RepID=A0A1Y1HVK0_KLENI|nr:cell cycle sensor kinase and response regulator [Klebsormidium nitens]|eukprot:GAQ79868.1 cell cycle sensor kinase and response regulator [Klebsormidium nitens]